jgi:hypothetical protein
MNKLAEKLYRNTPNKSDIKYIENGVVYPSSLNTIQVIDDPKYGGAHDYILQNSKGYNNGVAEYDDSKTKIHFVQMNEDGTIIPGVQDEQLLLVMLDRAKKLNEVYPSRWNKIKVHALNIALEACMGRVRGRIADGIMGQLKADKA